jgi:aminoglycoside phosphotransferase (APT) family kinase protein
VDWRDPAWLDEAHDWIRSRVRGSVVGSIAQTYVSAWATVMRVPTTDGVLWFKANAIIQRFEAGLAVELATLATDRVVEVMAADMDRGWFLMADAGERLRDSIEGAEQLDHWFRILPRYAELQLAVAPDVDRLLAVGVPDERLEGLKEHLAQVMDDHDILMLGLPDGVTEDELARLHDALPGFASMCSELAATPVPQTLQHDDFHDGQVFVRDGRYLFLDWGDSCISHPFHTLVVTLRVLAVQQNLRPGGPELLRLRDAYLEPFEDLASLPELRSIADLAHRTGTIARALSWYRYFAGDRDAERDDTVAWGLKMFLAGGPVGSWEL